MKKIFMVSAVLLLFGFSVLTGYAFGRSFADIVPKNENKIYAAQKSEVYEADVDKNKITPSTKLVYEYYYPITGEKETKEETAPYFMVDLTFDDLQKYYSDWQVTYFSADKVVMQKKVYDEKGQKYIIGEKDGRLTVFWETDKDVTLLTNRLSTRTGNRLVKKGRELTAFEKARFGKSKMIRYIAGTNEPL